jgi:EKC/KEOPS complex subunit PCC1/LAGE3
LIRIFYQIPDVGEGLTGKPLTPPLRTIDIPFPDARLASVALRAIQVDPELSDLVRRTLSIESATPDAPVGSEASALRAKYEATTNRMLRVSVNGFMENLALVLEVMETLDVDILEADMKKV